MITAAQATVLRHMADNAPIEASLTELIRAAILLPLDAYIQATDAGYILSDTGRIALDEYEAADDLSELEQALNANVALQARVEQLEEQINTLRAYIPTPDTAIDNVIPEAITMFGVYEMGARFHDDLMSTLPECPDHGVCIPYAKEWIERAKGFEALLTEAAQVIAPTIVAVNDPDVVHCDDATMLLIEVSRGDELASVGIRATDGSNYDVLRVRYLRTVAAFAVKLAARE